MLSTVFLAFSRGFRWVFAFVAEQPKTKTARALPISKQPPEASVFWEGRPLCFVLLDLFFCFW